MLYVVNPDTNATSEHLIPSNKHLIVSNGEYVKKGQKLTTGAVIPQALLSICGPQELQRYLVNEVQTVYRSQGVEINDKHIEIIIRQMMQKVRILDKRHDDPRSTGQGDPRLLAGELIDRYEFERENKRVRDAGGRPAEAEPVLLGITKASLDTDSFISAASFQDTTRILTDAATLGREAVLRGFKENVITGHLIPAGTGAADLQNLKVKLLGEELPPEIKTLDEQSEGDSAADNLHITQYNFGVDDDYPPADENEGDFGDEEDYPS